MTICYFGIYQKSYPRNQILIKGLRQNNIKVLECNSRKQGLAKYFDLWQKHYKVRNKYDVMIVGFLGQGIIKFAKKLTSKPIILDAFVSQYLTNVFDRKLYGDDSTKAKKDWLLDRRACELADLILLDTQAQINYFVKTFKLPLEKFKRIFVGADNEVFYPKKDIEKKELGKFVVHWHGYIVPFHGTEIIMQAIEKLKNFKEIEFQIVTRFNNEYGKIKKIVDDSKLENVIFYPEVSYQKLNDYINRADICLGVFSNNKKAPVVVPNKIYESLAGAKPLITANLLAVNELLIDEQNVLFCQPNNPQDLANKILELKDNLELRKKIATDGYQLYQKRLTPKILGEQLALEIKRLKNKY